VTKSLQEACDQQKRWACDQLFRVKEDQINRNKVHKLTFRSDIARGFSAASEQHFPPIGQRNENECFSNASESPLLSRSPFRASFELRLSAASLWNGRPEVLARRARAADRSAARREGAGLARRARPLRRVGEKRRLTG
jgi:hypothetical protein